MNVLYVTLISIGAPLVIILCALLFIVPLTLDTKARQAWQDLPREIYAPHRQRLFGLRPICFWVASAVIAQCRDLFRWLKWDTAGQIAGEISFALFAVVVTYQFLWAIGIVRSRADLDFRLVRFARFSLWGSSLGLLALVGWGAAILSQR